MTALLSLAAAPGPLAGSTLISLSGREALSQIGRFVVVIESDKETLDPATVLGEALQIKVDSGDGSESRSFGGVITEFRVLGSRNTDKFEYELRAAHSLFLTTLATRSRIFQNKTTRQIVDEVLRVYGSNIGWSFVAEANLEPRGYCTQFGETDFDFIARLLAEDGIWFFTRESKESRFGHKVIFADRPAHYFRTAQSNVAIRAEDFGEARITGWRSSRTLHANEYVLRDYNYLTPKQDLKSRQSANAKEYSAPASPRYVFPARHLTTGQGREFARLRMEREEAEARIVTGSGSYVHFSPGAILSLANPPAGGETDDCVITAVEHYADDTRMTGGAGGASRYRNTFQAMPARLPFRPSLRPRLLIPGLQTAVVTGPAGSDVHVDEHLRIKVQFHWDLDTPRSENTSCYVRVAQTWAGAGFGAQFIPRVGMEVLVDFIDGDCDRPIVVGCVYNGDNRPPFALADNKTVSGLRSVSSPRGGKTVAIEMKFEDKPGKEEAYFYSGRDFRRLIDNDDWSTVERDQTEKIKRNRKVTIAEGDDDARVLKGKSYYEAAKSIELKVGQTQLILDPTSVTIRTTKFIVDAKASAEVKSTKISLDATALLAFSSKGALTAKAQIIDTKANGVLTLKGGIVLIN